MDKIFIKDLVARGIIGVNDWERTKPQEILINIVLETEISQCELPHDRQKSAGARRNGEKTNR